MARLTTALLMLIGLLLMSHLPKYTIAQLKPMCISQFALANHACAFLPATESLTDRNNTRIPATADNDDDDDDDGNNDDDAEPERDRHNRRGNGNHGRRQRHENGNGHGHGHRNGSGHRQRHGHEHGREHREGTRAERDCCRWLDDIDDGCVCTVLLHLPRFLIKPRHQYRVKVGDSCVRTFKCGGI